MSSSLRNKGAINRQESRPFYGTLSSGSDPISSGSAIQLTLTTLSLKRHENGSRTNHAKTRRPCNLVWAQSKLTSKIFAYVFVTVSYFIPCGIADNSNPASQVLYRQGTGRN